MVLRHALRNALIPVVTLILSDRRCDGYAFATEEALIGQVVLSAAVLAGPGRPLGAVHIAGSLSEWSPEDFRKRFAPLAIEAARALSG